MTHHQSRMQEEMKGMGKKRTQNEPFLNERGDQAD
jgi:hypothetical protein